VSLDSAVAILFLASASMAFWTANESVDVEIACGRIFPLRE
jgi:predicted ribosomally synthesized peptide with SipW-like signal peptide